MSEEVNVEEQEMVAQKIKHLLGIYPGISPTMLQAGLGPQVPPAKWRPVLEDMIANKVVVQTVQTATTPTGRYNDYAKLELVN